MQYRTKYLDPDFRPTPKTNHFCCACYKDIKNRESFRSVHCIHGGMTVLHPEDEPLYKAAFPNGESGDLNWQPIGPDCAKKLGLEWTWPSGTIAAL